MINYKKLTLCVVYAIIIEAIYGRKTSHILILQR